MQRMIPSWLHTNVLVPNPAYWDSRRCPLAHDTHTNIVFDKVYPPPPCQQCSPTAPISWHFPCSSTWVGSGTFWGQVAVCHAPCAVPGQFMLCGCAHCAAGGTIQSWVWANATGVFLSCNTVCISWHQYEYKDPGFPSWMFHFSRWMIFIFHLFTHKSFFLE